MREPDAIDGDAKRDEGAHEDARRAIASRRTSGDTADGAARRLDDDDASVRSELSIAAERERVFAYLLEPRTYPDWLVGAKDIRAVDSHWPDPGARFHHRVGVGPLKIDDATTMISSSPPDELVLKAAVGPLGSALIRFRLEGSSPTVVKFDEVPDSGVLRAVGATIGRFLLKASVWGRNEESLQQLKELAETPSSKDAVQSEPTDHPTGEEQARINRELDPPA